MAPNASVVIVYYVVSKLCKNTPCRVPTAMCKSRPGDGRQPNTLRITVDLPVTVYAVELSMDITCNHSLYFINLTVSCITDCPLFQRGPYHSAHAGLSCAWFPFGTSFRTEVWIFYIYIYFIWPALYSRDFKNCLKKQRVTCMIPRSLLQ